MATATISYPASNMFGVVSSMEQPRPFAPPNPCPILQKFLLTLLEIQFDGNVFALNDPVEVTLYEEDEAWICEQPTLSIFAYGRTKTEAVHSFCEDFAVLWDEIAQTPDDFLSVEAQKLRRTLLGVVKSVKRDR